MSLYKKQGAERNDMRGAFAKSRGKRRPMQFAFANGVAPVAVPPLNAAPLFRQPEHKVPDAAKD